MGGSSSSSSRDSSYLKVFFGALALVGVISLLFFGSQESVRAKSTTSPTVTSLSGRRTFKLEDVMGGVNLPDHPPELDLNYMSKRRVPNGPDPIHNRKAGNSGRPPGRD